MTTPNESSLSEVSAEAYRLSERVLEWDTQLAIAADQRALSFCGFLITSVSVLVAFSKDSASPNGMLLAALLMMIAAGLAGYSARPVGFFPPGAWYGDFEEDIRNGTARASVIGEMGNFNDKHSVANRAYLRRNARLLNYSFIATILGTIVAISSALFKL